MLFRTVLPAASTSSSEMSAKSAGSTITSTSPRPSRSPSSRSSSVVNGACSGPRRPTMSTSSTPRSCSDLQRVIGDVGRGQHVGIGDEDPRHVQRDVAVAHNDGPPGRQVGRHLLEVGVRVVPADEVDGGDAAGQVLAGNAQRPVGLRADGVDHRVVALGQLGGLHMVADHDVAEEPEPRVQRRLLELGADRLDLRMVRAPRRSAPDPTAWAASPACRRGTSAVVV